MSRELSVGRVLVASLHEAISELLPGRMGFYESWLSAEALRGGTVGLAPTLAVLSFLRQEAAYAGVVHKAGEFAAEWTVQSMSPGRRRFIAALPAGLRRRVILSHAGGLVRSTYDGSRSQSRIRRDGAAVEIVSSLFCAVREPAAVPLCGYYAALFGRTLQLFDLQLPVTIASCRGAGGDACRLRVPFVPEPAGEVEVVA